jgi:hypothetical protein
MPIALLREFLQHSTVMNLFLSHGVLDYEELLLEELAAC